MALSSLLASPCDEGVGLDGVQHLGAEGHFAADLDVGCALYSEGEAGHHVVVVQGPEIAGQTLIEEAEFPEHVRDRPGVQLLVAGEEFLDRDRKGRGGDGFPGGDELFELHHLGFALQGTRGGTGLVRHKMESGGGKRG
ncbi:MAG: hypothetical protein WDM96_13415 [Lacunisphaera sp.]